MTVHTYMYLGIQHMHVCTVGITVSVPCTIYIDKLMGEVSAILTLIGRIETYSPAENNLAVAFVCMEY